MSTLDTLLTNITNQVAAVDGVRNAYEYPPDQVGSDISAIAYPGDGRASQDAPGWKRELTEIAVEVVVPRKDLPRDVQRLTSRHDDLVNALMKDETFGSAAETYNFIEWSFGPLEWGDMKMVGYTFVIHGIKLRSIIS